MWLKFTYTIPTVDNGIVGDAFCHKINGFSKMLVNIVNKQV